MGYTLNYRARGAIDPDREAEVRRAVEAFNLGRAWILALARDPADGRLRCDMVPADTPTERSKWPGPYEAKCVLDELCRISRELGVDWEVWSTYATRPVGVIRGGVCTDDPQAHADALRRMGEEHDRRARG